MIKVEELWEVAEPHPISEQTIKMLKIYPDYVPFSDLVCEYKWAIKNKCNEEDRELIRSFLVLRSSEKIIQDLEETDAKY